MTMPAEADRLLREGVAAMQRGDARGARALFERVGGIAGVSPPFLLIAQSCRALGDEAAEAAALDALLAEQPRHLRGLLMKGDAAIRRGDDRAAGSFYQSALASAALASNIAPGLAADLGRAQAFLGSATQRYEAHLFDHLAAAGFGGDRLAPGVQRAIDVLTGKREVFLQRPNSFYYPGLPNIEFYERARFAEWLPAIEAATGAIRAELEAVMSDGRDFPAYVEARSDRPRPANPLLESTSWGAFHLWKGGVPVAGNADRCPATMAALTGAPIPHIAGRSPMALFSLLKPGTHIQPHHGLINTRLICHLPLIVPGDCALRVGAETRAWREGEVLIFDDSIEHEAWNRSQSTRVILLFEIWRPELSDEERAGLTALYEAIGAYGGVPVDEAL
jgi:aspartyl/asparaginyl beta-hydroxylase (cupin superfamily)